MKKRHSNRSTVPSAAAQAAEQQRNEARRLAEQLLQEQRYEEALAAFQDAVKNGDTAWETHWGIAQAAKALGNVPLVDEACKRVLEAEPKFWFAQELPKHARGYYAQIGQDVVIENFFAAYPATAKTFVEVGGFDGVHFSNVRRLFEKYGWSGISIEPVEKNFLRLQKAYEGTSVRCVRTAVSDEEGTAEINVSTYPHLRDWGSDVATFSDAEMKRWEMFNTEWKKERVPMRTLTTILDEQGISEFDFLTIDVEGLDLKVLQSLDFSRFRPAFIVVEYNGINGESFVNFMNSKEYDLAYDNKQDLFFASRRHLARYQSNQRAQSVTGRVPLTYMIPVYNEEHRIAQSLEHALQWADEIIVINKSSTDSTKQLCLGYGPRVKVVDIPYAPKGHDDFTSYFSFASNDWIFLGTASEVPTRGLIQQTRALLDEQGDRLELVYVPRKMYSFGIHSPLSPWHISHYPFLVNRRKAVIERTIHENFKPATAAGAGRIDYSEDTCVYHCTHPDAKTFLRDITQYFEAEADGCTDPDAKLRECFENIAKFESQLRSGGEELQGLYCAWPLYWLGTALFVWEKKRGLNVADYYASLKNDVLAKEWGADAAGRVAAQVRDDGELKVQQLSQRFDLAIQQSDYESAHAILKEILDIRPSNLIALNNLALVEIVRKNWDEAASVLTRVLSIDPANADALHNRKVLEHNHALHLQLVKAEQCIEAGDTQQARGILLKILETSPKQIDALNDLAIVEIIEEHVSEAIEVLGRVLVLDPDNEIARENLAYLTEGPGDSTSAPADAGTSTVTAIVSAYNSERFMKGCLADLVGQTLYAQGRLEIIVVDSGSTQNERAIVEEFQKNHGNIRYIRTEERETIYAAWNRGIAAATGMYITNANTDDRHRSDALEVMARTLDAHPEAGLVYADVSTTEKENETFDHHTPSGACRWLDFNREVLSMICFVGPQPLWRKSLHDEFGGFDGSYATSGDWEFWLRIARTTTFLHIPEYLGVYLQSPQSVEHTDDERRLREDARIRQRYFLAYVPDVVTVDRTLAHLSKVERAHPNDATLAFLRSTLNEHRCALMLKAAESGALTGTQA
ncbi:MAG TPA: FkbM family methyltransferase [Bacteroidota bacterium]|nr:FkbM family methyltransferase [Bacteroidota bacterium]